MISLGGCAGERLLLALITSHIRRASGQVKTVPGKKLSSNQSLKKENTAPCHATAKRTALRGERQKRTESLKEGRSTPLCEPRVQGKTS